MTEYGTVHNIFSEAGYEELLANAQCSRHEQCLNCGMCLVGKQREFCDQECAEEYYTMHDPDDLS